MPVQSRVPSHRYIKRGDYHRSQARPGRPDGSLPLSGNKALDPRTLGATVVEPARHAHLDDDGRPEAAALATTGYFPSEIALVLDEAIALLPEMAEAIRQRPATEPPYQAVCEGIHDFGMRHQNMMALIMASQGDLDIPPDGPQRPLIDFEDTLAEVLRERYALPAEDQITPAVWARACIGALRTAFVIPARNGRAGAPPTGAPGDTLRACFAALQRGS